MAAVILDETWCTNHRNGRLRFGFTFYLLARHRLSVHPRSELHMADVSLGGVCTELNAQGLSHHTGCDVGILDIGNTQISPGFHLAVIWD